VVRFIHGGIEPRTHWIGGRFGPRAGLDDVEKEKSLVSAGNRTLAVQPLARRCSDSSILSPTLYNLHNLITFVFI
jgi:hypothetical protein